MSDTKTKTEQDLTAEEKDFLGQLRRLAHPRSIANNAILINELCREINGYNRNQVPGVVRSLALKGYLGTRLQSQVERQQREEAAEEKKFHVKPKPWWKI